MLNPLENHPLVLKVPEDVGQLFVRGVKGQLQERRDAVGRALGVEEGSGDVGQHGKGGVHTPKRERQCICGGEREGASQLFLWNRRWGQIGEKSDLVSGRTWARHSQQGRAKKIIKVFMYYIFTDILNAGY